jgi:hypothetical protein
MKSKTRVLITLGVGILLFLSFYLITGSISKFTGYFIDEENKNDLELCLEEKAIGLYLNSENIPETLNNIVLKDYLNQVEIVNCARNNDLCIVNNINVFPTWIINNQKVEKDITLKELKEYSDCKLITDI